LFRPRRSNQEESRPECREATRRSSGFGARARIRDIVSRMRVARIHAGDPFGLSPKPSGARVRDIRGPKKSIRPSLLTRHDFARRIRRLMSGRAGWSGLVLSLVTARLRWAGKNGSWVFLDRRRPCGLVGFGAFAGCGSASVGRLERLLAFLDREETWS
jgi:hypothetical protein